MIQNFKLNQISAKEFGKSIPVVWEMTSGINVTVNVTYNGILCCTAGPETNTTGQCDCLISSPGLFDPDTWVNISATAWNRISGPETKSFDVEVMWFRQAILKLYLVCRVCVKVKSHSCKL